MFDYQAGEKYKLTLIMVAVAGAMAGAFFTLLLSPAPEAPKPHRRGGGRAANFEGGGASSLRSVGGGRGMRDNGVPPAPDTPPPESIDKGAAQSLVQGILPLTWDFSSSTANQSQERAMSFMTQDCAQNYRLNVWTPEIAQGVTGAGMTSSFTPTSCQAITATDDGSVVVKVQGEQILNLQGQEPRHKPVTMEYLVKKTPQGLKISGISESGNFGS
jgi:hypothetical protein